MVGGGGVGGTMKNSEAALNVATVEFITACLASSSAPSTFGKLLGANPLPALTRMAALMIPELTSPPVTLAKLLAPTGTI